MLQHEFYTAKDVRRKDEQLQRQIVDGGLAICKVCGLAEGCLTTDCPGEDALSGRWDAIYNGELDFVSGWWVAMKSPHSPGGRV